MSIRLSFQVFLCLVMLQTFIMQTIVRLMLLAVLFVVVMETHNYGTDALVHGKFWRRCKKVDCRWGAFSKWGKCSESCGATGVQSRRRGIAQQASCGGEKCKGYQHQVCAEPRLLGKTKQKSINLPNKKT